MDYEFTATAAGVYTLQVDLARGPVLLAGLATTVPIIVHEANDARATREPAADRRNLERALALLDDAAKWRNPAGPALTLSDLLWTVFCRVEPQTASLQGTSRAGAPCRDLAVMAAESSVEPHTIEEARAIIRRALERAH
jgi:hypothetical protein